MGGYECLFLAIVYSGLNFYFLPTMSISSKHQKVKRKGVVREFKLVETVTRSGKDILQMEEVKTPGRSSQKAPSTSPSKRSCSPKKRRKLEDFDEERDIFEIEGLDLPKKRQTLVFLFLSQPTALPNHLKGQNDFLQQFLQHESSYLALLLDLEIPPTDLTCTTCVDGSAQFRCLDCYGSHWWCKSCLTKYHTAHPFHRPQQLKGGSFENVPLCDLDYVFNLGHWNSGDCCSGELFGDRRITIVHVNGVFEHYVRFCKCLGAPSEHEQLFRHRLFPSSFDQPKTAFTLDVLDYYGIDAMECKTSAQSFFQKLRRVTNNAFPDEVPVRSSFNCI
jgi:CxC2 like cysteine cluster associated with KDZ transposases